MTTPSYPEVLYHYTTITNLALILENRSIRFTRADKVNDLDEVKISDAPEIKQAVYLSCWTASEKESIPLWALYASHAKGIRIKLPSNMFKSVGEPYKSKNGKFLIINLDFLKNVVQRKTDRLWIPYLFGPFKVDYPPDNSVTVLRGNEDIRAKEIDVSKVGTIKLEHWKFEEEYRFIIFPNSLWHSGMKIFQYIRDDAINNPIMAEHVYIPLDPNILDKMEITMGPDAKDAEYYIVKALLEKYVKNGKILDSALKDKIRIN
jgi:hypothetical protein